MPIKMVKEIETVMTYHYIPVRMAEITTLTTSSANKNAVQRESPGVAGGNVRGHRHPGEELSGFSPS